MTLIKQSIGIKPELKKHIFKGFSKHAMDLIGVDGLSQEPVNFEMQNGEDFVGCAFVQVFWGQLHIKYLFVEEPFRNKGFASKLMKHVFEFGKSKKGMFFCFCRNNELSSPKILSKIRL